MSASKWAYSPLMCDDEACPGDCDHCSNRDKASSYNTLQTDFEDCRNELCKRCGDYKKVHLGFGECWDCRWKH